MPVHQSQPSSTLSRGMVQRPSHALKLRYAEYRGQEAPAGKLTGRDARLQAMPEKSSNTLTNSAPCRKRTLEQPEPLLHIS